MDIVELQREGYSPDKMLDVFAVSLTLAQVHSALAYSYEGGDESDRRRAEFLKKHDVG